MNAMNPTPATRREVHALGDALTDAVGNALARIIKLEAEVATLKRAGNPDAQVEWPIKAVEPHEN